MLKFKFFLKSESLENWLNSQSQMGNQCIKAFPDYYFMFKKSNTKFYIFLYYHLHKKHLQKFDTQFMGVHFIFYNIFIIFLFK